MKEQEFFTENVTEGSTLKITIKDVHQGNLKNYGKVFKQTFQQTPSVYQFFTKMIQADKTHDESELLNKFIDKFVMLVKLADVYGYLETIQKKLSYFGVKIELASNDLYEAEISNKKLDKALYAIDQEMVGERDKKKILKRIVDSGMEDVQAKRYLEKSIREDLAGSVEETCEVSKSSFMKAVQLEVKEKEGKGTEAKEKFRKNVEEMNEVLETIE